MASPESRGPRPEETIKQELTRRSTEEANGGGVEKIGVQPEAAKEAEKSLAGETLIAAMEGITSDQKEAEQIFAGISEEDKDALTYLNEQQIRQLADAYVSRDLAIALPGIEESSEIPSEEDLPELSPEDLQPVDEATTSAAIGIAGAGTAGSALAQRANIQGKIKEIESGPEAKVKNRETFEVQAQEMSPEELHNKIESIKFEIEDAQETIQFFEEDWQRAVAEAGEIVEGIDLSTMSPEEMRQLTSRLRAEALQSEDSKERAMLQQEAGKLDSLLRDNEEAGIQEAKNTIARKTDELRIAQTALAIKEKMSA